MQLRNGLLVMTVLEMASFRVVVGVLALSPGDEAVTCIPNQITISDCSNTSQRWENVKLTDTERQSKVRSLLHDALEAVEEVRVERTLHGVLLEGRDEYEMMPRWVGPPMSPHQPICLWWLWCVRM